MASDARTDGADRLAKAERERDAALADAEKWKACAEASGSDAARFAERFAKALAELEATKRAKAENDERFQIERDEARAERDNVSVEAHHWMGQAARYREPERNCDD